MKNLCFDFMDAEKTSKVAKCPQNNLNNYYCTRIKKKKKCFNRIGGETLLHVYTHHSAVCV